MSGPRDSAPAGGSPLERAVEVMDRLRSPDGCPWDAAQTHRSLARYLVEECYEVLEAIETDDPVLLREELGDLLLQVLFHARLAAEAPEPQRFDIDDVAGDLADKLVRRHPHVFADPAGPPSLAELDRSWEAQKAREKGRTSAVDGVPLAQPALALAAKLVARARRAGLDDLAATVAAAPPPDAPSDDVTGPEDGKTAADLPGTDDIGLRLLAVVRDADARGIDPETALRVVTRRYRAAVQSLELGGPGSPK